MILPNREQLNIGILGCGPIAQFAHLESVQKAKNVRLFAICDVAEDLLSKMAGMYQPTHTFTVYEEMLNMKELDAVIIATSDAFHIPAAKLALEAGKHVLVEKPLGTSLSEALELEPLLADSGLVLQVAHMKRFDEGISYARNFIQKEIGEILALKAWYADSTHRYTATNALQPLPIKSKQARKPSTNPKADKETYYMLAHGSHLLDTALHLAGPIESVQARLIEKFGAYCWFIDTVFENGANGHLDLTVAVRMDWHEGFQIYGEHGSVLGKTFNPWYYKSSEVQCFSEKEGIYKSPLGADGHFYRRQVESFAETILTGSSQTGCSWEEGIHCMKGMQAIAKSVKTGKRVYLKDVKT
ncbi:MAG: Gfo/Idh/MocA family oxidoreductase [Bacteroidota bacterium]